MIATTTISQLWQPNETRLISAHIYLKFKSSIVSFPTDNTNDVILNNDTVNHHDLILTKRALKNTFVKKKKIIHQAKQRMHKSGLIAVIDIVTQKDTCSLTDDS